MCFQTVRFRGKNGSLNCFILKKRIWWPDFQRGVLREQTECESGFGVQTHNLRLLCSCCSRCWFQGSSREERRVGRGTLLQKKGNEKETEDNNGRNWTLFHVLDQHDYWGESECRSCWTHLTSLCDWWSSVTSWLSDSMYPEGKWENEQKSSSSDSCVWPEESPDKLDMLFTLESPHTEGCFTIHSLQVRQMFVCCCLRLCYISFHPSIMNTRDEMRIQLLLCPSSSLETRVQYISREGGKKRKSEPDKRLTYPLEWQLMILGCLGDVGVVRDDRWHDEINLALRERHVFKLSSSQFETSNKFQEKGILKYSKPTLKSPLFARATNQTKTTVSRD